MTIAVKWGETKFPTLSHHADKFGCDRFCGIVDVKLSIFQATSWLLDLVGGAHLTWIITLLSFGAIGYVKVQI